MVYNISFEVAAIAFVLVFNVFLRVQYNTNSLKNKLFIKLASLLLVCLTFDVVTAITISYHTFVPIWLNKILNFMYFFSDLILEYYFISYCCACTFGRTIPIVQLISKIVLGIMALILVANYFTGTVFTFDETGYVHGPLYLAVYIFPIVVIFSSSVVFFAGFKKYNSKQRICLILYSIILASGPVVQILNPEILFFLFTVSVGFSLLVFALETPDYQALNAALEELNHSKKQLEKAMQDAQIASKAKSEFLSTMSHEIRTPINAIVGYAELIKHKTQDAEIESQSGNILIAGKRLLSMVNDILDFSKMDSDEFKLNNELYYTSSFLMDALSCGVYYAEKGDVEFRSKVSENIPSSLIGDSERLTQVIDNLVSNAAKYTNDGYVELRIDWRTTSRGKGILSVAIIDSGIGMKSEDIEKLSVFKRLNVKQTQHIPGVGLGLAIVSKLLSYMGSSLNIKSEYGKGTTMSFDVVQVIQDATPVGKLTDNMTLNDAIDFTAPNARILAVDDNRINLEIIFHILEKTKAVIDFATNGEEAIEMIKANHYDIIFMDHMMPVMNGLEALKIIKKDNLSDAPCIVVTANAVSGEKEMYLSAGFDDYISKPITARRLNDVIHKHLAQELINAGKVRETTSVMSDNSGGILKRLSQPLNVTSGMAFCCNDTEFYLQIIMTYIEEDKTADIIKAYNEKDYDNYRILVHALKSTSRTIGADDMSEEARKLEFAARENNIEYINANTQRVLFMYKKLIVQIKSILDNC